MNHPILFHMKRFSAARLVPLIPGNLPAVSSRRHKVLDAGRIVGDPLFWTESRENVALRAGRNALRWTLHEALATSGFSAEERKGWLLGSYLKRANRDPARERAR